MNQAHVDIRTMDIRYVYPSLYAAFRHALDNISMKNEVI